MLVYFLIYVLAQKPVYQIEIVSHKNEMPSNPVFVKIPGYQESGLLCAVLPNLRIPNFHGDPSELLKDHIGQCVRIIVDTDNLLFCHESESTLNGASLGFHDHYEYSGGKLVSYSQKGVKCNRTRSWKLITEYQCDFTVPKKAPSIPTFWRTDECTINTVFKTRSLCKHVDFSMDVVQEVKCISQNIYEKEDLKSLY